MTVTLNGLHPYEYEHSFDAKALEALHATRGVETLARWFMKESIERLFLIQYTGSNLQVTPKQMPETYDVLTTVCERIELPAIPHLYVMWDDSVNAMTVGVDSTVIVLTSGAVDRLSSAELEFIIGHEVGHLKSRHVLYHMMAESMTAAASALGDLTLGLGKLVSMPLNGALYRWSRMSELTADRAGLLACQDLHTAVSVFVKMAGLPQKYQELDCVDQFLEQAQSFAALDFDRTNRWMKHLCTMSTTHPWTVLRAAELLRWTESGEYDRVLQRESRDRMQKRFEGDSVACRNCSYRLEGNERFCPCCGCQLSITTGGPPETAGV